LKFSDPGDAIRHGTIHQYPFSKVQTMANSLHSYLKNYAEKETYLHRMTTSKTYQSVLVVPAFQEDLSCLKGLLRNPRHSTLLILVANAPPAKNRNTREFVSGLRHQYPPVWENQHVSLHNYEGHQDILLVDRSRDDTTIPEKQGVGLARKVGADIASNLIDMGIVESCWICNTDADVQLPTDYFRHSSVPSSELSARIYPFEHRAAPSLSLASKLYDISLHYYVAGLRWSGSPYAHHSIGSTLAVHYLKYAAVRGFPKRSAGEDFYLLNKLAKVGDIECLDAPVLKIEARLSDRTPFGTGHALQKIRQLSRPVDEYLYYNPVIFSLLKDWLSVVPEIWPHREEVDLDFLCKNATDNQQILCICLQASGVLPMLLEGLKQYKSMATFNRYVKHWFDAFRTLKFIHYLRDNHFPSVPLKEIIDAPFIASIDAGLQHSMFDLVTRAQQDKST
jgi:hypothetical protein